MQKKFRVWVRHFLIHFVGLSECPHCGSLKVRVTAEKSVPPAQVLGAAIYDRSGTLHIHAFHQTLWQKVPDGQLYQTFDVTRKCRSCHAQWTVRETDAVTDFPC